ncbi:MAG: response regulator [Deltaproteobacteria bacterium]|nr:response regulator [Deltaproteobacteria bacterium]
MKPHTNSTRPATSAPLTLTPHILVVDDDTVICEQLQRLYALNNFQVTVAHRGEEALEILENRDVDLVITDVRLPGISGVELSQRIAETWSDVPVIVAAPSKATIVAQATISENNAFLCQGSVRRECVSVVAIKNVLKPKS